MEVPTQALPASISLSGPLDSAALRRCSLWLQGLCREWRVPEAAAGRLDLILNEVLANLMEHGFPEGSDASVDLHFAAHFAGDGNREEGAATLTVVDGGCPFDPIAFHPKDLPRSLSESQPGGLGLRLVRSYADDLDYRRMDACNVLRVGVRWPSPRGGGSGVDRIT